MSANKRTTIGLLLSIFCALPIAYAINYTPKTLSAEEIAKELGWTIDNSTICGGYYLDDAFPYTDDPDNIHIKSREGFLAMRGTSVLENQVIISKRNEEITANHAFLYRDPVTFKLTSTDMIGNVHLREPNTLIIARRGNYNFNSKSKALLEIIYRTGLIGHNIAGPDIQKGLGRTERKVTTMTAWGKADEFSSDTPKVYNFIRSTFSTCPPENQTWQLRASKINLNKITGRGYATNALLYIKSIPIVYIPYFEFSIDKQRKSGFLMPSLGFHSDKLGTYFLAPFYWNIAPNIDMTLYPAISSKRGILFGDDFRYLSHIGRGDFYFNIAPNDLAFSRFQRGIRETLAYRNSDDPIIQAEYNRLMNDSTTRGSFYWRDNTTFNTHWSSHIDFNYASDDYYLKDYGTNLNEILANYLLEEADLNYKDEHWNLTGKLQGYETMHPIGNFVVQNQYRRYPQILINGDYPNQKFGLEYFIISDLTHFDIRNTPGTETNLPIGNRFHVQPGISLPLSVPYFYVNPRLQLALTKYNLYQNNPTQTPTSINRALPIFDITSGLALNRNTSLFGKDYQQTLEPQIYYTYIPYKNQKNIPLFDTTDNTLTYDQLFNYNRFTGIDRIGDANQISLGLTTRLIDQISGLEKVRFGIGEIVFFEDRRVNLCSGKTCSDYPNNPADRTSVSPLSSILQYHINPYWAITGTTIWDTITKQVENTALNFHYQTDDYHIINMAFSYAREGNLYSGLNIKTSIDNIKTTDLSFIWPLSDTISFVGRWAEDWRFHYSQSLLYGLQYDTCCWAVRLGGNKTLTGFKNNDVKHPQYTTNYYIQFDLKGLGAIGDGNPNAMLSTISGYRNLFGQEN